MISNTPFYLTSPLLFRLLASGGAVGRAVLTMQKEVGEKVLAPHGCKQYGILSVMLQLFAQPEAVFDIPPAAFRPMPKCTVSVLRFAPTAAPGGGAGAAWSATQREQLLALLKRTFEQRRKMLRQTLKPLLADAATPIPDEWLTKRPEQLSPLEWVSPARWSSATAPTAATRRCSQGHAAQVERDEGRVEGQQAPAQSAGPRRSEGFALGTLRF